MVNAILRIVFECIAIYFHIVVFDWILVKGIAYGNIGSSRKEKNTPCIIVQKHKKLKCIIQISRSPVIGRENNIKITNIAVYHNISQCAIYQYFF